MFILRIIILFFISIRKILPPMSLIVKTNITITLVPLLHMWVHKPNSLESSTPLLHSRWTGTKFGIFRQNIQLWIFIDYDVHYIFSIIWKCTSQVPSIPFALEFHSFSWSPSTLPAYNFYMLFCLFYVVLELLQQKQEYLHPAHHVGPRIWIWKRLSTKCCAINVEE